MFKSRHKSVKNSIIMMQSIEKKTDERELKKRYTEIIRQYLPQTWKEYEMDAFIEALFNGIYVPSIPGRYARSEFVEVISGINKKWLFSRMAIWNESNTMIIGWKYFPNPNVRYEKKTPEKPQK